jgi:hypothetical protein
MKNALRWIAVLPGAFLAMLVVNTINWFTAEYVLPDTLDQIGKAWFGSIAFVMAAGYIAPKGKFITSVVVASAYSAIGIFAVILAIANHVQSHPIWLEILTTIVCVFAAVVGCAVIHGVEKGEIDLEDV